MGRSTGESVIYSNRVQFLYPVALLYRVATEFARNRVKLTDTESKNNAALAAIYLALICWHTQIDVAHQKCSI